MAFCSPFGTRTLRILDLDGLGSSRLLLYAQVSDVVKISVMIIQGVRYRHEEYHTQLPGFTPWVRVGLVAHLEAGNIHRSHSIVSRKTMNTHCRKSAAGPLWLLLVRRSDRYSEQWPGKPLFDSVASSNSTRTPCGAQISTPSSHFRLVTGTPDKDIHSRLRQAKVNVAQVLVSIGTIRCGLGALVP